MLKLKLFKKEVNRSEMHPRGKYDETKFGECSATMQLRFSFSLLSKTLKL